MRAGECLFMGESGRAADIPAMTDFEPQAVFGSSHRTCLSPLFTDRTMEAWYHPPWHEWPPTGGSHGKLHRTTNILSHARRGGGCVAARGRGAASDPGDRL